MAEIRLERLTKRYGRGRPAVDDLSLDVAQGELLVVVGPSGCGKSTTLRLIAGLERADAGTIRIGERCVDRVAPRDRDVAMVFQNYALYPHLTVFDNLAFGLRMRSGGLLGRMVRRLAFRNDASLASDEVRRRVVAVADKLSLAPLLSRYPRQLSGGERQRVALGRAIVREPAAFLFDEPLSNLDARLRDDLRREMKRALREVAAASIYVTHDQAEAMALGDRIAILREGRLQQVAPPQDAYGNPRNAFVAGFLGSPGMNLIPGEIRDESGSPTFHGLGIAIPISAELRDRAPRDAQVTVGFRPDEFDLTSPGDGHGSFAIEGDENLGDVRVQILSHGISDARRVVLRKTSAGRPLHRENPCGILLNESRLHWFATETGDNLRFA